MRQCPTCKRGFLDDEQRCPLDQAMLGDTSGELPHDVGRSLGHWRLVGLLGTQRAGRIFVARHARLGRLAAVTWLRPELNEQRQAVARYLTEVAAVNDLHHPNVIESFDLVDDVLLGAHVATELWPTHDLRLELAGGPLEAGRLARIGAQLADALAAAHSVGVFHGALRPEAVLLSERGCPGGRHDFVKLAGLGVARLCAGLPDGEDRLGGSVVVKPDLPTDLCALGAILYEAATGLDPRADLTAGGTPRSPNRCLPPERSLPAALERVLMRCVSPHAADTFTTAAEVAAALRSIKTATAPTKSPRPAQGPWRRLTAAWSRWRQP